MEKEEAIAILQNKINYLQKRIVIAKDNPDTKKSYIKEMSEEKQAIEKVLEELKGKNKRIYYLENIARADIIHEIDKHKLEIYKNYIPKKKIQEFVLYLRLFKRHVALNDEQRKVYDVCIKEAQQLLEDK